MIHAKTLAPSGGRQRAASLETAEIQLLALGESERSARLGLLRRSLDDPTLRVVVFGEFSRGKSTLINALLGRLVLPAKLIPTTGHVTWVVHGPRDEVLIRFRDGREQRCGLNNLESAVALDPSGAARQDVDLLQVSVAHPLLAGGIALVDTPGLNDKEAQTQRARRAIATADLVLMVLDARRLLNESERGLAVDWLDGQLGKPVALVVNFMGSLGEGERRSVRGRLEAWTRKSFRSGVGKAWYEVDARSALRFGLGEESPPRDDFGQLRDALAGCVGVVRKGLQRRSRHGQIQAELAEARAQNQGELQRLGEDAAAVERERAELRQNLDQALRRFGADAAGKREELRLFALGTLNSGLGSLVDVRFKGESKQRLEVNAAQWYATNFTAAVEAIEKKGAKLLRKLAGRGSARPAELTLRESLILRSRIEVAAPVAEANGAAIGWGAGMGALVGTFVFPGFGTAAGAAIGGWLAGIFGSVEPDYPALFSARARENWQADADKLVQLLEAQVGARIAEIREDLDRRYRAALSAGGDAGRGEIHRREELDRTLALAETLLRSED